MLTIWGRANSINVQKVLWCCDELDLKFDRIDAGRNYGRVKDAEYLAMNPNGRVPTLIDGDFVLWESNSIMRYLALNYGGPEGLYPAGAGPRSSVDRWLDWVLSTLNPAARRVALGYFTVPPEQRNLVETAAGLEEAAPCWKIVDRHLAERSYAEGEAFTLADIGLGVYARRWFGVEEIEKPAFKHLAAWYERLKLRSGFQRCLVL